MELDIFEGLESILENDNAQVQVDQVSKLETNSNENGKLKNDWELRMRNFCASIHFKLNGVAQGWSRGTVQAALISSCEALELHSRMKEKLCARLRPSSPFLSFLCFYGSSGGPTSEAIAASTASILTEFIQTKMDGQASRSGMDHSKDTHDQSELENPFNKQFNCPSRLFVFLCCSAQ